MLIGGCGTFSNLTEPGGTRIYGGVGRDVDVFEDTFTFAPNVVVYSAGMFAAVLDLPFSAIADTLTLAYVVPVSLGWTGNQSPATPILRPSVDGPAPAK